MKRIELLEAQKYPNGTKVLLEFVGSDWILDPDERKIWSEKQKDGLHYLIDNEEHVVNFQSNDNGIICYIEQWGCDCCLGDEAVFWIDKDNNVFIDSKGELQATIKGDTMKCNVKCCPKCGRNFNESIFQIE